MSDVKRGYCFDDGFGVIRVMCVAEGYAMVRRKRSAPFILTIKVISLYTRVYLDESP